MPKTSDPQVLKTEKKPNNFKNKAGPGRPKGLQNKMSTDLKEMILAALSAAGGVQYLTDQAVLNPNAFMSLVGKVLPMTVNADVKNSGTINVTIKQF